MRPLPMEEKGGVLVVRVSDNAALNEGQAAALRQALYAILASRPTPWVAIDLANVDFVSSTGIALLIGTKRRVDAAQGQLALFHLHPDILDLFDTMRLTTLFEIVDDEAAALALSRRRPLHNRHPRPLRHCPSSDRPSRVQDGEGRGRRLPQ